ncbi:Gfo/Idh/MocA family oxidoreductase [Fulvivirga sp. M361]|uniref:Gfo/Idh/MocA family protein n=1 Tax=Fulvivirga sp. M361 TaxID=2594266 RepID=UPI001179A4C4|nr:Gfo/Idh/MocA family oxidoreductase [Fulvivirga sp. M361]TRX56300.1 Gfo/Idh/MocA family oxidoreductase [Fulvivirga sp. M361]
MKTSRRAFLKASTAGCAGLVMAQAAPAAISFMDSIGVGIVGMGDRGTGIATLIKGIEGMEFNAFCEIIPSRYESARQYGQKHTKAYKDYRRLIEDKSVEAIVIATPFSIHAEIAMAALEAGKHIYCEKTLAYGIAPIRQLVEKAKATKTVFQTGHQYHSSRLYRHVMDLIHRGYLGHISLIECQWNRNGNWRKPVTGSKWDKMINWRMYREYSGGLTAELCSHQIDFANWVTGSHPIKVAGFGGIDYWKDGREVYDNIHLITEYPNGMKATYTSLTTNAKDNYQIKVLGQKGSIVLGYDKAWVFKEHNDHPVEAKGVVDGVSGATLKAWETGKGAPIDVSHIDPTRQALIDFKDNIIQDSTPQSNATTGAKVAIVVNMALEAMDNNSVCHWKDEYNFF